MANEKLFNEFEPVSTEKWEEVIQKDLKGADYERKLVWKTDEGFKVRPYYRAEDLEHITYLNALPNEFPYVRGTKVDHNAWEIVQEVKEADLTAANKIACEAVNGGATTLVLNVRNVQTTQDWKTLLCGIDLNKVGIQMKNALSYPDVVKTWLAYLEEQNIDKKAVKGGLTFDVLAYCLRHTRFYASQESDMQQAIELIELTKDMPHFKVVNVQGIMIHNGGSTLVQELGYALGIANEYLAFATAHGLTVDQMAEKMEFTLSISSNYFMEIAKLRAFRLLWATMLEAYQPADNRGYQVRINSVASMWNMTIYDPYVNMLRNTTEAMSAAIGGADTIALNPFDVAYKATDEFSRRISRNTQIILKEESYFDKVVDPAAGSYYIENLTDSLAENAWKLFQSVENDGGMAKLILDGTIQKAIEASCQIRNMNLATRKSILLGTNQYPNINEQMADKMGVEDEKEVPAGLKNYRGASAFEALRLATEKYAATKGRPKVFLLKIGNLAMRQARAGFITNFFGCAGYEILDNTGFATVDEGIAAAQAVKADLVVMCSSDEEYATLGVDAAKAAKREGFIFIIAGNPQESIEALKAAGTDDFIHVKTNVLESLAHYNTLLLQ